ncbi:MAG: ABC transporter permease subunit [Chloroflexi bacterium]|nr:ABC transporter permease subunit [Chloroflexota bacterium]
MKLPRALRIILNIYALALAVILLWPVLQMVMTAFSTDPTFPPQHFSLYGFREVLWSSFFKTLRFSLKLALWVSLLLLVICLPAAYAMERRYFAGRSLMAVLIFVPTIFPAVTYVSAIAVYVFVFFLRQRGSFPVVVVATAMSAIPLVVRSIQASIATTDPVYEEAALIMGANPLKAFAKITLPLIAPGLLTAAMIAFTSATMAFTGPQLLGSKEQTVSMFVYDDMGKVGFTSYIAVEILVMQAVVLGVVQTLYFVFRKQFRGLFV